MRDFRDALWSLSCSVEELPKLWRFWCHSHSELGKLCDLDFEDVQFSGHPQGWISRIVF